MHCFAALLCFDQLSLITIEYFLPGLIYSILELFAIIGVKEAGHRCITLFDSRLQILAIRLVYHKINGLVCMQLDEIFVSDR